MDLLFAKRNLILEGRSKRLAEKVKTKWLHEGEKSNKYFLNMLHAKRSKTDIDYLNTGRGEVGIVANAKFSLLKLLIYEPYYLCLS